MKKADIKIGGEYKVKVWNGERRCRIDAISKPEKVWEGYRGYAPSGPHTPDEVAITALDGQHSKDKVKLRDVLEPWDEAKEAAAEAQAKELRERRASEREELIALGHEVALAVGLAAVAGEQRGHEWRVHFDAATINCPPGSHDLKMTFTLDGLRKLAAALKES